MKRSSPLCKNNIIIKYIKPLLNIVKLHTSANIGYIIWIRIKVMSMRLRINWMHIMWLRGVYVILFLTFLKFEGAHMSNRFKRWKSFYFKVMQNSFAVSFKDLNLNAMLSFVQLRKKKCIFFFCKRWDHMETR